VRGSRTRFRESMEGRVVVAKLPVTFFVPTMGFFVTLAFGPSSYAESLGLKPEPCVINFPYFGSSLSFVIGGLLRLDFARIRTFSKGSMTPVCTSQTHPFLVNMRIILSASPSQFRKGAVLSHPSFSFSIGVCLIRPARFQRLSTDQGPPFFDHPGPYDHPTTHRLLLPLTQPLPRGSSGLGNAPSRDFFFLDLVSRFSVSG